MAKQVGIIQFNGALGETIGAPSVKGYQVIKKRPVAVHNPNTIKQRTQRTVFAAAGATSSAIPVAALAGLRPTAKSKKCSIRNAFTNTLLADGVFTTRASQQGEITTQTEWLNVKYSRGTLAIPSFGTPQFDTPDAIDLSVTIPEGVNPRLSNIIIVVVCSEASPAEYVVKTIPCWDSANNRAITTIQVECPSHWNGMQVQVYGYLQAWNDQSDVDAYYHAQAWSAASDIRILESNAQYSNTKHIGVGRMG